MPTAAAHPTPATASAATAATPAPSACPAATTSTDAAGADAAAPAPTPTRAEENAGYPHRRYPPPTQSRMASGDRRVAARVTFLPPDPQQHQPQEQQQQQPQQRPSPPTHATTHLVKSWKHNPDLWGHGGRIVACDFCPAEVPSASGDLLPRTGSSRFAMYQFRCKKCTADADATPAAQTDDTAVSSDAAPIVDATAATTSGASSAGAADATTPVAAPSASTTAADVAANTADAAAAADLVAPSNPTPDPTATCRHGNVPMLCPICKREGLVVQPPKRYTGNKQCQ